MSQLILEHLTKTFGPGQTAVNTVNLCVNQGEFIVIVGPSGCGKSTILRMIAGLESVSSGRILLNGKEITKVAPGKRQIAMVFQSYALYPHMTVEKNMGFSLKMGGMAASQVKQKVRETAQTLQLTSLLKRKPGALSGGQRQRVAIGRAIIRDPALFLFDEPLSNLDAELRGTMRLALTKLHKQLGTTMIYVTHDQTEAMTMADRILVLRNGALEQVGTPMDLFTAPANQFVAGFMGTPRMNFVPVELQQIGDRTTEVRLPWGPRLHLPRVPAGAGTAVSGGLPTAVLGIRPGDVKTGKGPDLLTVDVTEVLGSRTLVHGTIGGCPLVLELNSELAPRPGETLPIRLPESKCHLFAGNGTAFENPHNLVTPEAACA